MQCRWLVALDRPANFRAFSREVCELSTSVTGIRAFCAATSAMPKPWNIQISSYIHAPSKRFNEWLPSVQLLSPLASLLLLLRPLVECCWKIACGWACVGSEMSNFESKTETVAFWRPRFASVAIDLLGVLSVGCSLANRYPAWRKWTSVFRRLRLLLLRYTSVVEETTLQKGSTCMRWMLITLRMTEVWVSTCHVSEIFTLSSLVFRDLAMAESHTLSQRRARLSITCVYYRSTRSSVTDCLHFIFFTLFRSREIVIEWSAPGSIISYAYKRSHTIIDRPYRVIIQSSRPGVCTSWNMRKDISSNQDAMHGM